MTHPVIERALQRESQPLPAASRWPEPAQTLAALMGLPRDEAAALISRLEMCGYRLAAKPAADAPDPTA